MAVNVPIVSEWKDQGLKNAARDIDSFSNKAKRQFDGLAAAGRKIALGFAAGTAAAAAFAKSAVNAASDFDESASKLGVIIGDASEAVIEFAKNSANIGISANEAAEAAGKFAIFGKAAGLAGNDLADFTTDFIALGADLASFNNSTPQEAIDAIGAALRGEAEPLRRFGVLLDDASMRAAALELGIYDGNGALQAQQKILAAQKLIYDQTGDAQGDFERTSGGLANQQRILAARLSNLRMEIGLKLLPVFTKFAGFIVNRLYPAIERFTRFAWKRLTDAFQSARPFLERIADLFNNYIRPAIERLIEFMRNNEDAVKTFFAVLAGAATIAGIAALASALGRLATPLGLVVAAIAAVSAAVVYMYQNFEWFRNIVDPIGRWFRDKFPGYFVTGIHYLGVAWNFLWENGMKVARWFQRTFLEEDSSWRRLILGAWTRWTGALGATWSSLTSALPKIFSGAMGIISGFFNIWAGIFTGDWSRVWNGITSVFSGAWNLLVGLLRLAITPFLAIWGAFGGDIIRIWNFLWGQVTGFFSTVVGLLLGGLALITGPFILLWNLFGDDIIRIWNRIWDTVSGVISTVGGIITGIANGIMTAVNGAIDAIQRLARVPIPNPIGAITSIGGGILGGIRNIIPFADGGLVTRPTLGLVGEAGPELVVPLDRVGQMGQTVVVNVQGSVITEKDLIEQIRVGLIRSQRSGRPLLA